MTSYVNLCMAKKWREFAALSRPRHGRRKMKLSEPSKPRGLTFCISRIFHSGHLGSGQSRDLPIIGQWGNTETDYFATKMI